MNLTKEQCALVMGLWLTGHEHGVDSPQPIKPDCDGKFVYADGNVTRRITSDDPPLSDLIGKGYMRIYDESVGSVCFTAQAEDQFAAIRDAYFDMCKKDVSSRST